MVDGANRLKLGAHVGERVSVTGMLVDKELQVGLNTRFGPQFYTVSGPGTDFAFTTQITVGYRL